VHDDLGLVRVGIHLARVGDGVLVDQATDRDGELLDLPALQKITDFQETRWVEIVEDGGGEIADMLVSFVGFG